MVTSLSHKSLLRTTFSILLWFPVLATAAEPFAALYDPVDAPVDERKVFEGLSGFAGNVEGIGDINGDGLKDMVGWLPLRTSDHGVESDAVLIYGSADRSSLPLDASAQATGVAVLVPNVDSLGSAGDLDGDGNSDWVYHSADLGSGIVLGQSDNYETPLLLGESSVGGKISVFDSGDSETPANAHRQIAAGGDINGDGIDDLLVQDNQMGAYGIAVVLGGTIGSVNEIDLSAIPAQWQSSIRFSLPSISGSCFCQRQFTIGGGGDFNADGYDDIVLSLRQSTFPGVQVFLIYGSPLGLPPHVNDILLDGTTGFSITDGAGAGATLTPDISGDGIDDLLLSLENVTVLYGGAERRDAKLDPDKIRPEDGYTVSDAPRFPVPVPAGDINNDGIGDWLTRGRAQFGDTSDTVFVVYGTDTFHTHPLRLSLLDGSDGFIIDLDTQSAAAVSDTDGDGIDDLLIGANDTVLVYGQGADNTLSSPRKVRAVLGNGFIGVRWLSSNSEEIVGYDIFRDGVKLARVNAGARFYKDETFLYDTHYSYDVIAVGAAGAQSLPLSVNALHDAPELPQMPESEIYSDSAAELFFYSEYPTLTHVYRNNQRVALSYAQSYLDYAYNSAGQSYYLEVEAYSLALRRTILLRSPILRLPEDVNSGRPAIPGSVRFAVYSSTTLELFWTSSPRGAAPFEYEISRDGDVIAVVEGTSYIDQTFTSSWRANYEIVAIGSDGLRSHPARFVAEIGIGLRELAVAVATGITASVYSDSVVELFWQPSEVGIPPVGYDILRDGELIGKTSGTSFLDTELSPNTRYFYNVRPFSADGSRAVLSYPGATVVTGGYPQPIAGFEVRVYGPNTAELLWERAPTTVRQVRILRNGAEIATSRNASFIDNDLVPGETYLYTLVAESLAGLETPNYPVAISTPAY